MSTNSTLPPPPGGPSGRREEEPSPWSAENQERARSLLAAYPDPRSAVMPLLYLAMTEHGYVSEQAVEDVAAWIGLTPAQVLTVVTFYTMYKQEPVGRYLLSVCTSLPCMLSGADEVLQAVEEETGVPDGETDHDRLFSVEHVECIGACGGATAVQVNYELVEGVSPGKARELCRWLRDARPRVVLSDEMQQLFGGLPSFEWGPPEREGAILAVPAFGPYGTAASDEDDIPPPPPSPQFPGAPPAGGRGRSGSGRRLR
ncbi:MAG: NAD(P)H-dependent oxidoreductase subunit E [Actinomycetota bacterium]|nr:NAD(P)H-dependent oxidoreductase subunit E [Actinomycetota bacterium]